MGIDTRYWGPSGWQLFHLIAFKSPAAKDVLDDMKSILPCPFCRESTIKFVEKHPIHKPFGKWLYHIHNMVNDKLRTQCSEDPKVINPGPDPSYEEVKATYDNVKMTAVPGRDFLMAVAYNFPSKPEPRDMSIHRKFLHHLADAYPFDELRSVFQKYIRENEPILTGQRAFTRWMYELLKRLSEKVGVDIRSYRGYMSHLAYYKSGCARKTYRGKTCRRTEGGGFAKSRNHSVTRRITHRNLL